MKYRQVDNFQVHLRNDRKTSALHIREFHHFVLNYKILYNRQIMRETGSRNNESDFGSISESREQKVQRKLFALF